MPDHETHIFVDRVRFDITKTAMTGAEIRALPSPAIGPDRDLFLQVPGPGDDRKIADEESVELKNGTHFYSAPRSINPGGPADLPEDDEAYLASKGGKWGVVGAPEGRCLVIEGVSVSAGKYDRSSADVMIRIPSGYPIASLDMFYVDPPLTLNSGGYPPSADHFEEHCGRRWQRFSRHLPTPWRPGLDGLPMFLSLVLSELQGTR